MAFFETKASGRDREGREGIKADSLSDRGRRGVGLERLRIMVILSIL